MTPADMVATLFEVKQRSAASPLRQAQIDEQISGIVMAEQALDEKLRGAYEFLYGEVPPQMTTAQLKVMWNNSRVVSLDERRQKLGVDPVDDARMDP